MLNMARIRTIKPSFFRHELLQEIHMKHPDLPVLLVFVALWGHCDKAGSFLWKTRLLKLDIFPFIDFDLEKTLAILAENGLIHRYEVNGVAYGYIPGFHEHQRLSGKELTEPQRFPAPRRRSNGEATGKQSGSNREAIGKHRGSIGEASGNAGRGRGREYKRNSNSSPTTKAVDNLAETEGRRDAETQSALQKKDNSRAPDATSAEPIQEQTEAKATR
jgi:hypothetical protein